MKQLDILRICIGNKMAFPRMGMPLTFFFLNKVHNKLRKSVFYKLKTKI